MTVEEASSRRPKGEDEDESGDDESVSSDDSQDSSSSVDSAGSPAPALNPDQIRQNARVLLQSSPGAGSEKKNGAASSAGYPTDHASGYQSYQDAPTVGMSNTAPPQFPSAHTAANPPWADNAAEEGLSVTDVASMAFNCVAHCLTEGYRAASNYYGGYQQEQYPSVSGPSGSGNYQQVSGYSSEPYGNGASQSNNYQNGYSDGYQSKFNDNPSGTKEVMDRGQQASGQGSTEQRKQPIIEQKEEWATVPVPSTYQGGRVGSGN